MRINKEIKTLSPVFDIIYLGVGSYGEKNFARSYCSEFYLIEARRNSIKAIVLQIFTFLKIILLNKIQSIHVINEQLMVFFYPFLFFKHTVLDVFDSIFLMWSKPKNEWNAFKRLVYLPVNKVIVTDENRVALMPDFLSKKLLILENYPNRLYITKPLIDDKLTIFYNGSMSVDRGTLLIKKLIEIFPEVKIIMAGWLTDDETRDLAKLPIVDYRGILTQNKALMVAVNEAHYILSCYEPINENNINASPNKIYDAIQTETPVIINKEVKVSNFVEDKNIGYLMDSFYPESIDLLYKELVNLKNKFKFSEDLKNEYSWETIENKLILAHKK